MKVKKHLKILAVIFAVILLLFIFLLLDNFVGNPILYAVSKNAAQDYLEQHYDTSDYVIKDIIFSQKRGSYNVVISSPSSIDTEFTLVMNRFGGIEQNTYDDTVSNRFNTGLRLNNEYRELVDEIIFSDDFPAQLTKNSYGRLAFHSGETGTFDFSVDTNSLVIDKELSRKELNDIAKSCGDINLTIQQPLKQTEGELAHIIKNLFIKNDVAFYNLTILTETQNGNDKFYSILYDDIV